MTDANPATDANSQTTGSDAMSDANSPTTGSDAMSDANLSTTGADAMGDTNPATDANLATSGATHEIALSAGTIRYRDSGPAGADGGDGDMPVIVFVHGLLVNGLLWRKVAPLLEDDARVIVPDWPFGSHTTPMNADADLSPRGAAHLIAEFLAALELTDAVIVGNDTGGAISQVLVTERPQRVGRLVLTNCDALENFPPAAFKPMVAAAKAPGGLRALLAPMRVRKMRRSPVAYGVLTHDPIPDEVTDAWVTPALDNADIRRDTAKLLRGMRPEVTLAAAEQFPSFTKPVLIAWGADDKFFALEDGRRLGKLFPNARFEEIRGSRTFVPEDHPERLAALVREFVREPVAA
jgi:pimeloyl-ACP methyl ester carboxylesterase